MAWYTAPSGATCVAAYDFVGASSLADSYINEANPGTFDCAPGVAPTWAYGTGVTFNGTTQHLLTGVVPLSGWSMIVRFSGGSAAAVNRVVAGQARTNAVFTCEPSRTTSQHRWQYGSGTNAVAGILTSGVMALAAGACYVNGVADGSTGGTYTGTPAEIYIGSRNGPTPSADAFFVGDVQAVAIYSGTLTLADVVAITATMNALPTVAGKGLPVIEHWHNTMYLR